MAVRRRPSALGAPAHAGVRGGGLFADGLVDTILFDSEAIKKALAYVADNPRRLWQKRLHPEFFRVTRDFELPLEIEGRLRSARFAIIGNHNLLRRPHLLQVQCSRSDFAYARSTQGEILKDAPPATLTAAFEEKAALLLAAAAHGAVLVSPCISQGEKEIARRAFAVGHSVITLQDKGFSPLYKPGGKLFDTCTQGNLLMMAPANWPYLPGKQTITRSKACILNRLAQLLAGNGAADINYRGLSPAGLEHQVAEAIGIAKEV